MDKNTDNILLAWLKHVLFRSMLVLSRENKLETSLKVYFNYALKFGLRYILRNYVILLFSFRVSKYNS